MVWLQLSFCNLTPEVRLATQTRSIRPVGEYRLEMSYPENRLLSIIELSACSVMRKDRSRRLTFLFRKGGRNGRTAYAAVLFQLVGSGESASIAVKTNFPSTLS